MSLRIRMTLAHCVGTAVSLLAVASATGQSLPAPGFIAPAGGVFAIEPEGSGLRVAEVELDQRETANVEHFDAAGKRTGLETIATTPAATFESAALTPSGGVAVGVVSTDRELSVRAGILDHGRSRIQRISTPGSGTVLSSPLATNPTGAAGVVMLETRGKKNSVPVLAFKPAGASRFRKPVQIAGPQAAGNTGLVVLGPDGGGVVLSLPDVDLSQRTNDFETTLMRRITPSGKLGPARRIAIGDPRRGHIQVEARGLMLRDGTFAAVLTTDDTSRAGSWFAVWRAGAKRPSTPRRLAKARTDCCGPGPALTALPGGKLAALIDVGDGERWLFSGSARRLARTVKLPAYADWSGLAVLPDRRLLAYGQGFGGFFATTTDAPFGAPTPLTGSQPLDDADERQLGRAAVLPDGRLALPWTSYDGQVGNLLLFTP